MTFKNENPIMKIFIICCVSAQIPSLEKSGSLDIVQNAPSQLHFRIFKLAISPEQIEEIAYKLLLIEKVLGVHGQECLCSHW